MHNMAYHVDDAVARHYNVPLWSKRHFELLAKSHRLMAEAGSRQVFLNLAPATIPLSPNTELLRWVKQPDGGLKPDFTVFDRYLDMIAKSVGTPLPLRLNIWGAPNREGKWARVTLPLVPRAEDAKLLDLAAEVAKELAGKK